MKTIFTALLMAFTLNANAAESRALFQYNNSSMLGGEATRLQIRENGDIHLYRGRACLNCRPSFDAVIDRLDQRAMDGVHTALAILKPGMKLRELTAREKRLLQGCAMDSSVNYIALGEQYEHGRLVVWRAQGCGVNTGLANAKAERAMSRLRAILEKALEEQRNK